MPLEASRKKESTEEVMGNIGINLNNCDLARYEQKAIEVQRCKMIKGNTAIDVALDNGKTTPSDTVRM